MSVTNNNHMQSLHEVFEAEFLSAYTSCSKRLQRQILPYLQAIYRRWYYSSLVDGIQLTPANLVDCISHLNGLPVGTHIFPQPVAPLYNLSKLSMRELLHSPHSHPVVTDIRLLVDLCHPHIDISEDWSLTDKQATDFGKKLSLPDPYYASFLYEIAYKMGMLERTPSLYVQRVQVAHMADEILSQPHDVLFRQIIDAVIEVTSVGLQLTMPAPVQLFTVDGLRSLLVNPIPTDDILHQAFATLGFNVNDISMPSFLDYIDIYSEESEALAEMVSGIFVLGIMLDRLLFTPFGHFLRLIRPLYVTPVNLKEEFSRFSIGVNDCDEGFSSFFEPCTSFKLTELGLWFFNEEPTEYNYLDTKQLLTKDVVDVAFSSRENVETFVSAAQSTIPISMLPSAVYNFRVTDIHDPDMWFVLEVPKSFTLHHLFCEICENFLLERAHYNFYHGETESPFTRYDGIREKRPNASPSRATRYHECSVQIRDLDFSRVNTLLLVIKAPSYEYRYKFEYLGHTAPDQSGHYPRVTSASSDFEDFISEWDE